MTEEGKDKGKKKTWMRSTANKQEVARNKTFFPRQHKHPVAVMPTLDTQFSASKASATHFLMLVNMYGATKKEQG